MNIYKFDVLQSQTVTIEAETEEEARRKLRASFWEPVVLVETIPAPRCYEVTIAADVRCYHTFELEAETNEEAIEKAKQILDGVDTLDDNDYVLGGRSIVSILGGRSVVSIDLGEEVIAEGIDLEPGYAMLEDFVVHLTKLKLSSERSKLNRHDYASQLDALISRARELLA